MALDPTTGRFGQRADCYWLKTSAADQDRRLHDRAQGQVYYLPAIEDVADVDKTGAGDKGIDNIGGGLTRALFIAGGDFACGHRFNSGGGALHIGAALFDAG